MVQEPLTRESVEEPQPADESRLKFRIILKFFAMWLSSLAVLVVIALLSNIEWARRHIETALRQSFHRQVHLGRLSWSFGLQGLAIDTDRLELKEEKTGAPFISSGPSEIGIAVLPLLQKKLVVKHLEFEKPEVWAIKLDAKRWNFSDLITEGPEIRMLRIEDGQLHLLNHDLKTLNPTVEGNWQKYDLKNIKLSLTLPKNNRTWPAFLSFKLPVKDDSGHDYDCSVRLSATGKGPFDAWNKNKYTVDLQLQKFDPSKFRPLLTKLPKLRGICDLTLKGSGIFDEGFSATADGGVSDLRLETAEHKELVIASTKLSSNLMISPGDLRWTNLNVGLQEWQLNSDGSLSDWQTDSFAYKARIGGQLSDLKGFFNTVVSRFLPDQAAAKSNATDNKLSKIEKATKNGELAGKATIELHLNGNKTNQTVATNIKADGIPLAQLVDDEMASGVIEAFKLNPDAPIRGELSIDPGKKLELKDLEIPMEDSKIHLSGFVDTVTRATEIEFNADNLSFDTFKKRIGEKNELIKAICGPSGKNKGYYVAGNLDIKGSYKSDGVKDAVIQVDSNLKGLKLTRVDSKTPAATGIKGQINYSNDRVDIKQLSGSTIFSPTDSGDFALSGSFNPKNSKNGLLDLKAHGVNIATLKEWSNRFNINLQERGFDRIAGDLHELKAHAELKNGQVASTFTINPSDLYVNLAGTGKANESNQLRLSSGVISYEGNELKVDDVVLSSRAGKLTLDAGLSGALDALKFRWAKIRTDGYELADLHSVWRSNMATPPAKSASTAVASNNVLPSFLTPSNNSQLHGKVYGEMQFSASGANAVSGVVGFSNAGGRFGKTQVAVEKLTGVAVITKDQIVLQDTTGQIGKSTFNLDGTMSNYAQANCNWQGQLRGQFYPDEVDAIMDNLGHGIALSSRQNEALSLRVTGNGDMRSANLKFRGRAAATQVLNLKTAFGVFRQPKGRPLDFQGGLKVDDAQSELVLNDFQMNSASEVLHADGAFRWANETAEKPASLSFALKTPSPVKTATLVEITSQKPSTEPIQIGGTSDLNLKVEGPVNDLVLTGNISLDKNTMPSIHMDNLTGKLDLPGWHFNKSGNDSAVSIAKLQLKSLNLGGLALREANTTLSLEGNKISFKDFQAAMSGGKVNISGYANTDTQSFHAEINASKLVVDELVKDLIDHSGGVTGLADVSLSIDKIPGEEKSGSLTGSGKFNIYQGSVASFGKLQVKLNEANLLQQGLFGFNVNNLLQAMMPVNSGQFNEVSGDLRMSNGSIQFEQVRFEGNNLRMRAAGRFDYLGRSMEVAVAGDIPRVSSSLIPGPIGEMSRKVTLQRMFRIVTFKKLKDLPALPLLGDLANDDPRAFAFSVSTSTESPKLITQAVEKSFKWLPNKPFASAHPVPGI